MFFIFMNENVHFRIYSSPSKRSASINTRSIGNCYKISSIDNLLQIIQSTNTLNSKNVSLTLSLINNFCMLNKISRVEDVEEICNILFQLITSDVIQDSAFGFACFSNIFLCSKFKFPLTLLPNVVDLLFKMIDYSKYTLTHTILYICVKLSGESIQHSRIIAKYFDMKTLMDLIQINNKSIKHKTLYLIGNICSSINISEEFANFICEATNYMLELNDPELLPEAIWCFENLIKQYFKWRNIEKNYYILNKLNKLLKEEINDPKIVSEILFVIELSFKCTIGYEIFDLEFIINLMKYPNYSYQIFSIRCLLECVRNNYFIVNQLVDLGLFNSIEYIMTNGTFKGKYYAVLFIDELLDIFGKQITEYLFQINIFSLLFDFLSSDSEKVIMVCLHVLSSLIHFLKNDQIYPNINFDVLFNLVESTNFLIAEKAQMIMDEIQFVNKMF